MRRHYILMLLVTTRPLLAFLVIANECSDSPARDALQVLAAFSRPNKAFSCSCSWLLITPRQGMCGQRSGFFLLCLSSCFCPFVFHA